MSLNLYAFGLLTAGLSLTFVTGTAAVCFSQTNPELVCKNNSLCQRSCIREKWTGGHCGKFRSTSMCYCEGCTDPLIELDGEAPDYPAVRTERSYIDQIRTTQDRPRNSDLNFEYPTFAMRPISSTDCSALPTDNCKLRLSFKNCAIGLSGQCSLKATDIEIQSFFRKIQHLNASRAVGMIIFGKRNLTKEMFAPVADSLISLQIVCDTNGFSLSTLQDLDLPYLTNLGISRCDNLRIGKNDLSVFPRLKLFNLYRCTIQELEEGSFELNTKLRHINFEYGYEEEQPFLPKRIAHLRLLHCDCRYQWLRNFLDRNPSLITPKKGGELYSIGGITSAEWYSTSKRHEIFIPVNCSMTDDFVFNPNQEEFSINTQCVRSGSSNVWEIAGPATAGVVLLLCCAVYLTYSLKKRQTSKRAKDIFNNCEKDWTLTTSTGNAKFDSLLIRYTRLMNISRERLEISETILGKGSYGIIHKGLAHELPFIMRGPTVVAVKTIIHSNDLDKREKFEDEMKIMAKLGRHIHVVSLLGVVLQENLLLLLEYCGHGSLLNYLRARQSTYVSMHLDENGSPCENDMTKIYTNESQKVNTRENTEDLILCTNDLIIFAYQICRGMEYLVSRKIIHRDLAARNVLVTEDKILKISDFGLAKQGTVDYMANSFVPLPVLWMPPEAILNGIFSQKSDVWSYGVLLWEMFSLGQVPFDRPDVAKFTPSNFAAWLLDGGQMERPLGAPCQMYELMQKCWNLNSDNRPVFSKLQEEMDQLVSGTQERTRYLIVLESKTEFSEEYKEIMHCMAELLTE